MKRIGIIGCGAIGSNLASTIDSTRMNAKLVSLFDTYTKAANRLAKKLKTEVVVVKKIEEFLSSDMDLIVESASQEAVRKYAKKVLEHDLDLMIMSVGALLNTRLYNGLVDIAAKHDVKIYIPTGAIAGIDAIRSVKHMLDDVTLTTTKNPAGLEGAPFFDKHNIDLKKIKKPTLVYKGNALEAVKLFPANVNVAAVLSLAGIGPNKTQVRIVADPNSEMNLHEITARGKFGEMHFQIKNVPSPTNPKTSYLAALSAIECLRAICNNRVNIGT
ncbi:MAG: aspartate dehydrogenase [Nitrososphaerales archaeon]